MQKSWNRSRVVGALTLVVVLGMATQATAHHLTPDRVQTAWYNGTTTTLSIVFPTGPPNPANPVAQTYITAPMNPNNPQDLGGVYPPPPGQTDPVRFPAHDQIISRQIPKAQHTECFGAFVKVGPNGNSTNVRTRVDPNGSGHVLAYEVKLSGLWLKLKSVNVVTAGVNSGLLRLDSQVVPGDPSGYGGICWTS